MHFDVTDLRDFYARPLGLVVRRLLAHRVRARWRNVGGETLIGLGFTSPFLGAFRGEPLRLGALMPAEQGALVWPTRGPKHSVLVEESQLPLPDGCVDRLLAAHCLEGAERVRPLLREMWRVLKPEGRLMLIVANRRSVWARFDYTPFGHGRPYSRGQVERLLGDALFAPTSVSYGLYLPPIERPMVLRSAIALERLGARISPGIGGVIIVEARKELIAPIGKGAKAHALGTLAPVRSPSAARGANSAGLELRPSAIPIKIAVAVDRRHTAEMGIKDL